MARYVWRNILPCSRAPEFVDIISPKLVYLVATTLKEAKISLLPLKGIHRQRIKDRHAMKMGALLEDAEGCLSMIMEPERVYLEPV